MGKSIGIKQSTTDKLVHLIEQQKQTKEGSKQWIYLQEHINRIVAQNYLEYVNS